MRKEITHILVAVFCIALVSVASAQTYYYTDDAFEKNFGNTKTIASASTRVEGTYLFLDNDAFERRFGKPVASPSTLPEDSVTDIDDTSLSEETNIDIVPIENEGTPDIMPMDNDPEGQVVDTDQEGEETASEAEEAANDAEEGNTIIIPQENKGDAEVVFPDDGEIAPLAPEVVLGDVDADTGITKNSDTTKIALIGLLIVVVVVLLIVLFTKEVPEGGEDTDWKETSFFKEIKSSKPKAEAKETKPKETKSEKKEQEKNDVKTEKKEAGKPPASKAKIEEKKEFVSDVRPKAEKPDKPFLLKIKEDSE
jgi:Sec-independent protein translocase protein TatA